MSITTPASGATYNQGQVVDASYNCAEGAFGPALLSGSAGCTGPVADGAAIDTSTTGSRSFAVTATSADGQTTTQTVSYTVLSTATAADISVSLSGPASAADGSTFTETLKIANAGPANATSVLSTMTVPNGVSVVGAGGGMRIGGLIVWSDSAVAAGGSLDHVVTFRVGTNSRGRVTIAAAAASLQVNDPNYSNNATATVITLGPTTAATPAPAQVRDRLALGGRLVSRLERALHHSALRHRRSPTSTARDQGQR